MSNQQGCGKYGGPHRTERSSMGPFEAASAIREKRTNGWWFFLVDPTAKKTLRQLRTEYVVQMSMDTGDDEGEEDDGEDKD